MFQPTMVPVDGGIDVGDDDNNQSINKVNGGIDVGEDDNNQSINNVNGGIDVGDDDNTVNGGVDVGDDDNNQSINNVNGGIDVGDDDNTVNGGDDDNNQSINNVNGGIDVGDDDNNQSINNVNGGTDVGDDNNNNVNGMVDVGDEEFDSENQEEGSEYDEDPRPSKRKRYHRHTPFQIQEMEAFFRECPHPDDHQRKELSHQLGLHHLQIKFWFQNKRTQNKNQLEHNENTQLRAENNKLRADNHRYREAMMKALCPTCGSQTAFGELSLEEHHLRLENARLRQEIDQLAVVVERCTGKPVMSYSALMAPPTPPQAFEPSMGTTGIDVMYGNLLRSITGQVDVDKRMIIELAVGAMEELMAMAQVGEPLWTGGFNGSSLALNLDEYTRTFPKDLGPRLRGYRTEASRETALVAMNQLNIVQMLMNENLWPSLFAGMIARATTHEEILMPGVPGNFDGALQIMSAELQVLSPLVSTRKIYFVRFSKQQADGSWAVVDVSIDHLIQNVPFKCRRRPSGCLIQEISNGYSKVTWVEHVEVDDRGGVHNLYKHLICSGQAFGANRWVATLDRQCERIASIVATEFPSVESNVLTNQGMKSVLKLADRMVRSFFAGVTTSMRSTNSGGSGDDIRIMTVMSPNDSRTPPGVILCAATSFWVTVPPQTIFDFLKDENNRTKWDVLSTREIVHKISEIANGRDSRNGVALFRSANTSQSKMMMVQESSIDPTASFLIYAPIDMTATEIVLSGGDPDYVVLLPSGIAILPDGVAQPGEDGGGSLLTVAFQMLVETGPSARLTYSSVATVESLIRETVQKLKALFPNQAT